MVKFVRTLYSHALYTRNEIRKLDNVRGKSVHPLFLLLLWNHKTSGKSCYSEYKPCQISIIAEHIKQQ